MLKWSAGLDPAPMQCIRKAAWIGHKAPRGFGSLAICPSQKENLSVLVKIFDESNDCI